MQLRFPGRFAKVGQDIEVLLDKLPNSVVNLIPKLDFVHLIGITDGVNQALEKNRKDFKHLAFLVDH